MSAMMPVVRRNLSYTGWVVSGASVLLSTAWLCFGTSYSFFPVWASLPAALGLGMAAGMAWTLAAAVIHTRAGARPMDPDRMSAGAGMMKIPVLRLLSMTVLLAGVVGCIELLQLADLLSMVQASSGLGAAVWAAGEVFWRGLGTDLIISSGLVFVAQLLWLHCRDRIAVRRLT